jgi:hypothetical protein
LQSVSVIGFKGGQAGFQQLPSRHDDDVEAERDLVTTKNLSYESFNAISRDRAAQFLRRRDPEAPDPLVVGQDEDRTITAMNPDALPVNPLKVHTSADPLARSQASRRSVHSLAP